MQFRGLFNLNIKYFLSKKNYIVGDTGESTDTDDMTQQIMVLKIRIIWVSINYFFLLVP